MTFRSSRPRRAARLAIAVSFCPLVAAAVVVVVVSFGSSAARAAYSIGPGFLYTPSDSTSRQFSPDLQLVGTGGPSNPFGSTGAAITHDGLFVYSAFKFASGSLPTGAHLLALDGTGAVVHELYLSGNGLNRASGIAVDASGDIYTSSPEGLHQISPDFSSNVVLPISFGRASGVAVAPNDWLYVSDQNNNVIKVLDAARQVVDTIPTGPVPSGVTIGPDGALYYTDTPFQTPNGPIGRFMKVDLATHQQQVIFGDLWFPMDVEFAPDGSYYLATQTGREIDHYSAGNQLLGSFNGGVIGDQLAFYVPEPTAAGCATIALLITSARRRRRRCHHT